MYDFGKRTLSFADWDEVVHLINSMDFWNFSRRGMWGEDGSDWLLEGVTPDKYYVTSFWSPGSNDNFYKTCMFLIKLSGIEIKPREIY